MRALSNASQNGRSFMYFSLLYCALHSLNAFCSLPLLTEISKIFQIALRRAPASRSLPFAFARALTNAFHAGVVLSYIAQASKYSGESNPDFSPIWVTKGRCASRVNCSRPSEITPPSAAPATARYVADAAASSLFL